MSQSISTESSHFYAKKKFSQHFLCDKAAAIRIVSTLSGHEGYVEVLEIGPGLGALTEWLLKTPYSIHAVEIDPQAVEQLLARFGDSLSLLQMDVLRLDIRTQFRGRSVALIGNLPYSISSSVCFLLLEARRQVPEAVFLLQEEVARRLVARPGSRSYGLLSVLLQAYYELRYCFSLPPSAFSPRPKVHSGLLQLRRHSETSLSCRHTAFVQVVKQAFSQRRKMLRNALSQLPIDIPKPLSAARAEQLSVAEFAQIAALLPDSIS